MLDIIILTLVIAMPVAALLYTVAIDKRDGVNGW